jgi:molecular chaperone Hsp33
MKDYLVRAMIGQGEARILAVRTTELVEEARARHDTWHTVTAALGRALTGAAMLGAMLKEDGVVTIRVAGDGPINGIVVQADRSGRIRGYALEPQVFMPLNDAGKLDVGGAVGREGNLYVTYDLKLKEPYTGISKLVSGEIGEDLTFYLARSEQIPSAVALGVMVEPSGTVKAAGGLLVQLMPEARPGLGEAIEERLGRLNFISSLFETGLAPEEIIQQLFGEMDLKVLETMELRFECRCSRDRAASVLLGLGEDELQEMLEEDGGAEVRCHFCGEIVNFNEEDILDLLGQANSKQSEDQRLS